jgi:amino acid transporter
MPYGSKTAMGGTALAFTGFSAAGWIVGAITMIFLGIALVQLARRSPAMRP